MKLELKVGKSNYSIGSNADLRGGRKGEVLSSPMNSKYSQMTLDGECFIGSNALGTPVTTQPGLSATTPALTLYNPATSGVNLVLLKVNIGITTAPAANTVLALAYNAIDTVGPTSTTAANVVSSLIGSQTSPLGKCSRIATLTAAPTAFKYLGGILAAASTTGYDISENIDGEVIIAPGTAISIQSTTAVAILASFTWQEIPL